ncbi:hypothetical protein QTP70_022657 [Hemibagrus guttatus]|uniref:Tc1-like transposase DDE domain-containing protein n=1 Tax=Hemibagrus guttatus TaxID=175788 RepID=A0AAE0RD26_9TELE|nr:hypothetical protein QTP70_022657 [Hemibagrus guttatus]
MRSSRGLQRIDGEASQSTADTASGNPDTLTPHPNKLPQDNVQCHKAKMVQEWFHMHNNKFEVLAWPPNSTDLSPIKHLWDVLDKQVQSMEATPCNLQDLNDLLLTSWCQIPQLTFRDLVESMPQRVRAVLAAKEGPAQY